MLLSQVSRALSSLPLVTSFSGLCRKLWTKSSSYSPAEEEEARRGRWQVRRSRPRTMAGLQGQEEEDQVRPVYILEEDKN